MKKFYMILAALAAMTMTAQAQDVQQGSLQVGDFDNPTEFFDGSYFDFAPTNFYVTHTGAQMLYTPDELADMQEKSNVQINKLSFKFYNESAYEDINRTIKVSVQAVDEAAFPINPTNNKKQFFNFDAPVLELEVTFPMLDILFEDTEVVFDLANAPVSLPAGKSLLVTAIFDTDDDTYCNTEDATFYSSGIRSKAMVYTDNNVSFADYALTEDFPNVSSGTGTNVDLPVTKIDYTYTDAATAIDEVKAATSTDGAYYNLMGQKFDANNLPAGIYIHNGKKVERERLGAQLNVVIK